MATSNNIGKDLVDLLATHNFDVETSSAKNPSATPDEATVFKFDYVSQHNRNYGTAVIVIGDDNDLILFYGDNLGRGMEPEDKDEWFAFMKELKDFSVRHNFKTFSPKNLNQLKHTMQGMAAIKEGLFEGYYGSRRVSYMGPATEARLVINHNRLIGENDKRFRYIESLFIETVEGERFRLPFKHMAGARAMLEHVRQGGRPYDIRGQHIADVVNEMSVLSRFRRAQQGRVFEGVTRELVEQANQYYQSLHTNLKHMSSNRGYRSYFESWTPADIGPEESLVEDLRTMFVEQTIDSRIEQALPTLAKLKGKTMKEADIFESWANRLTEGTWALPDNPEAQEKLNQLMSSELIVGPDATNATELLYDVVGDDELYDILDDLAARNPRANIWDDSDVIQRMQELGIQLPNGDEEPNTNMDMPAPGDAAEVREGDNLATFVEGSCNHTREGEYCPEHGLMECGMYESMGGTVAGAVATGVPHASEGVEEGSAKYIKRSVAGWGWYDKDKPKDVVNKVKGQDTDVLKRLHEPDTKKGKGSPAELQQKAISRELKRRGKQGVGEAEYDSRKPYGVRYRVFAGRDGRLTTKEFWTTSSEKLKKAVAKIEALGNFYEIDGYSYPKEQPGVSEEYTQVHELSKDTLQSYRDRTKEKRAAYNAAIRHAGDPPLGMTSTHSSDEVDRWIKKYDKMGGGMKKAANRIKNLDKQGVSETNVAKYRDLGATADTTHFVKNVTTGKIVSPHRSRQDAEDALVALQRRPDGNEYKIVRARKDVTEGDDRGDYHSTARAAEQATRQAKDPAGHRKAAGLHDRAATYALSAGHDSSVVHDHQMAAREHTRAARGLTKSSLEEAGGAKQYNEFKREWRAKHGADAKVPGYDSREYTSYCYRQLDKKHGVSETRADPTSTWVVYDGKKVQRFKTHAGAKAYAEKHGGKVASSAHYADRIQKSEVKEGLDIEAARERLASLQRDLKAVTGNYPGDDRNRMILRRQIFDLKAQIKSAGSKKSEVKEGQLNEYLVNEGEPFSEVLNLNVFMDTSPDGQVGMDHDPQWQQLMAKYQPIAKQLEQQIQALDEYELSPKEVDAIHNVWYDGSDAYDDMEVDVLARLYDQQIKLVKRMITVRLRKQGVSEDSTDPMDHRGAVTDSFRESLDRIKTLAQIRKS